MRAYMLALLLAWPAYAQHAPVVFSEIMWMGSSASSADEWVELYNVGEEPQDLRGWTLTRLGDQGEEVLLTIEEGQIDAGQTFLIANYEADHANSHLATVPQLVNSALSLPNSKLQLSLYAGHPDEGAKLVDVADDGRGAPLAGDATLKRSMERTDLYGDGRLSSSWQTADMAYGWDPDSQEMGTPGALPMHLSPPSPSPTTAIESANWAAVKEQR